VRQLQLEEVSSDGAAHSRTTINAHNNINMHTDTSHPFTAAQQKLPQWGPQYNTNTTTTTTATTTTPRTSSNPFDA